MPFPAGDNQFLRHESGIMWIPSSLVYAAPLAVTTAMNVGSPTSSESTLSLSFYLLIWL